MSHVQTYNLTIPFACAGTPFWKLVLKQFDDLLVKVEHMLAMPFKRNSLIIISLSKLLLGRY